MVDYYIKCIQEHRGENISNVGVGKKLDKWIETKKTKKEVILDIDEKNKVIKTAYLNNKEWVAGNEVHTVEGEYIRTDRNDKLSDNLGELPNCPD
ncbi:hypothetical protein AMET1_0551 [Methanonatronarchaeum thermophilum]|uniref:DUF3892 domain-containing protein n=1 Tax=Methanonatronarchaeum thermophilum TaxID=1927129 RepID=A0A1Y3GCD5_9EURY|nr:DUF3892 domain-containing protein [Methanonatronarchaeum thermophilum]OUJ18900.1 hypothetical protein AMET1_0551 [Methanonatronarchaeum thermophilum]